MITKKTKPDDPEFVELDTITDPEPPVEPVEDEDCGCSRDGNTRRVRMRHPNLSQTIEVNPVSVPNWEKTGWETAE